MISRAALALLLAGTLGCAAVPPPAEAGPPASLPGAASCDALKVQSLIGKTGTPALAARARKRSNAASVRFLKPGQIVTMEYRADRLNIHVDAGNRVISIRCG